MGGRGLVWTLLDVVFPHLPGPWYINIDHFPKNLKYNRTIIDVMKTSRFHKKDLKENVILPVIPCILLTGRFSDSLKATYSAPGNKVALWSMRLLAVT